MEAAIQEAFEGKIDFQGQKITENIARTSLSIITGVSFILGFIFQSMALTFATFGGASLILTLVVVPPWPVYNKHPVKWLPAKEAKKEQ